MKRSPIIAIIIALFIALTGCQSEVMTMTATPDEQKSISVSAGKAATEAKIDVTHAPTESATSENTEKATETAPKAEESSTTHQSHPTTPAQQSKISEPQEETSTAAKEQPKKADTKPAEKETTAPKKEPATSEPKPTQPSIDEAAVIQNGIAYGESLGIELDSSLNTGNSSWFSPTAISYFHTTEELTGVCYEKIDYLLSYWGEQGYKAQDFYFNFIISDGDLYLVYA